MIRRQQNLRDLREHQVDQHMHYGRPRRREKGAGKLFEELVAPDFLKVDERQGYTYLTKLDEHKVV